MSGKVFLIGRNNSSWCGVSSQPGAYFRRRSSLSRSLTGWYYDIARVFPLYIIFPHTTYIRNFGIFSRSQTRSDRDLLCDFFLQVRSINEKLGSSNEAEPLGLPLWGPSSTDLSSDTEDGYDPDPAFFLGVDSLFHSLIFHFINFIFWSTSLLLDGNSRQKAGWRCLLINMDIRSKQSRPFLFFLLLFFLLFGKEMDLFIT